MPRTEVMEWLLKAVDNQKNRLPLSMSTGELAVGSRVLFVKPNIGVVATQALAEPRLGILAIHRS